MTPDRDRVQALVHAIRCAVDGRLQHMTMGQLRAIEATITESTERDLADAATRLLMDALDAVLVLRLHPCKRPKQENET